MTDIAKYGFSSIRQATLPEINATLYEMEHIKSGARLVYLNRDDENKTFSIGFATPPENDTGVFHIIEHSVLCGSEKYPLKDPFAELLKGSLNTFLNAVTYEDRTVYPVSSRCEKDFLNLVDVYMDAVLQPNLRTNPNIFRQEGWHYEYDGETGSLSINGVVYNEMKGAYSSPDELGMARLQRLLYDDCHYRYDSGGNPEHIPSLTYEYFKSAHDKYYHPSGAKIILDGKMNIENVLALLDSRLCRYDKRERVSLEGKSEPRITPTEYIKYEISESESEHGKARVLYGFVYSDYADKEAHLTASILCDLLCGSNASPLKKALLDKGLAKDAAMYVMKSREQTVVLEIRDADEERIDEIEVTVNSVIRDLAKKGIGKEKLSSTLNSIEFRLRERDFGTLPTGIAFAMSMYGSWIYGGDPESALLFEDTVKSVREKIESSYFEDELLKITLDNPHRATLVMLPDNTLGQRAAEEERKRLDAILNNMPPEELERIKADDASLKAWQQSDESEEAISSLPRLLLTDIPKSSSRPMMTSTNLGGVKILKNSAKVNGIIYISLCFDACDLADEELLDLSMLSGALLNFPTESRDTLSLQNDIKANLGSLFASFAIGKRDGVTKPYFKIGASALTSKTDDLLRIIADLLTSKIEDEEEMSNLVSQVKSNIEDGIISSGESFAMSRAEASYSESGAINEYLSGYEAYRMLSKISAEKENISALTKRVADLLRRLTTKERLSVFVTGEADDEFLNSLISLFPKGDGAPVKKITALCAEDSEFILIPSKVAYAILGGQNEGVKENLGIMRVARSILSYEYLWNTVRVQSGAYGTGFVPRRDGNLAFYSYRDPSPARSLEFYRESVGYLRALADSGEDITKFVIGAIGEYDMIMTPRVASAVATADYLSGWTEADEEKIRQDMLSTTAKDLHTVADIIDRALSNPCLAIVGSAEHLSSLPDQPKRIIKI